ncbi:MAG: hypothetical protein H0V89_06215 [Deltaproteobacteria bacterium]|nr:hypothetical protein [Deltaproteobacteria bacterium]
MTGQGGFGAVLFESRYLELDVEITRVGLDCAEVSEGLLPAGGSLSVGAGVGEVLRVYTEEGTLLSARELVHFDGGTVVLR